MGCVVRQYPNGEVEMADMQPGEDGFMVGVFSGDGTVVSTEVPNLLLNPPVLKRPAARPKKAAAKAASAAATAKPATTAEPAATAEPAGPSEHSDTAKPAEAAEPTVYSKFKIVQATKPERTYLQGLTAAGKWQLIVEVSARMAGEHRSIVQTIRDSMENKSCLSKQEAIGLRDQLCLSKNVLRCLLCWP